VGTIDATTVFADISGYTRLAERLLPGGPAGTELLLQTIDTTFTALIDVIHAAGGDVLRFGGDALFVVFTDGQHRASAARCAAGLQSEIARLPSVAVPGGRVRLRLSVGMADGTLRVVRWCGSWIDEIVFGPLVTETLALERAAAPGQVRTRTGVVRHRATPLPPAPRRPGAGPPDPSRWMPPRLARVGAAGMDPAHRSGAVGFVGVRGLDRADHPAELIVRAMDHLARVTDRLGVVPLCTDVAEDGVSMLVTAGAVESDGDDAERLLAAASELVRVGSAEGIDIRAGIHAGLVFSAVIGHPQRRTVAALGDTTNVAARLMQSSAPGSVLVSGELVDRLSRPPPLNWRQPVELRGRRAPVAAAEVMPGDRHRRPAAIDLFIGRRRECDRIVAALTAGGVAEVIGPTGSGTSSVVDAVMARLARPALRLTSGVDDIGVPFGLAIRLATTLGTVPPGSTDRAIAADFVLDLRAAEFSAAVQSRLPDDVVLSIDSGDHVDPGSRRVLERLAAQGTDLLVAARRPLELNLPGAIQHEVVELGPLEDAAIREIAIAAARRPLSGAELDRMTEDAGGNPGIAIRLAADPGGRRLSGDLAALAAIDLDHVPAYLRPLARAAAVCGPIFDHRACAAVAGLAEDATVAALTALAPLIEPVDTDHSRFADELTRQALVSSMPVAAAAALSSRFARHLVSAAVEPLDATSLLRIAHAFADAQEHEATVRWGSRAAAASVRAGAPHAAADAWSRTWIAAQHCADASLPAIALAWADAAAAAGVGGTVDSALRTATRHATDPVGRADLVIRRARIASREGRFRAAATLLGIAKRAIDPAAPVAAADLARARLGLEQARVLLDTGRPSDAATALRRATTLLDTGLSDDVAQAAAIEADIAMATARPDAEQIAARALVLAQRVEDPMLIGAIACNLGLLLDNRGEWPSALEHYELAERSFSRAGSLWSVALTRLNRSTILLELGDADGAASIGRDAARELATAGVVAAEVAASTHVLRAELRRGIGNSSAVAGVRHGAARLSELGEDELAAFRRASVVEMLLLTNKPNQAAELAEAELTAAARFGEDNILPVTLRRLLSVAQRASGAGTEAVASAREALLAARLRNSPAEVCLCLHVVQLSESDAGRRLPPEEAAELSDLEQRLGVVSYPWFRRRTLKRGEPFDQ
jgi:class 3 adenylate cyclase/tetratricopeptide (TPR) repeat protein